MPRPSSIKRLPREIQELIGRLREEGRTIDEILSKLSELGADVSRAALGRHTQQIDRIGEHIRKSRAMADAMVARFGDEPESKIARFNIELGHALLMKLMVSEDGGPVELDPKEAMFVMSSIRSLTAARKTDADYQLALRREIAKDAAKAAEDEARNRGLGADTIDAIKRKILGVAA